MSNFEIHLSSFLVLLFFNFSQLDSIANKDLMINQAPVNNLELKLLEQEVDQLKTSNDNLREFYRDTISNIQLTVNIFVLVIGGAFALFGYLFKRPDEIWKKINETEKQAKEILKDVNALLEALDLKYEHQETAFLLNKKSLFNYTQSDWNLVSLYSKNALKIEERKRSSNDWIFIGLSLYKKIEIDDSIKAFEKATGLNPENEIAWKHLGNAYHRKREVEKAIYAYNKVIEIDPSNDAAYSNLGVQYTSMNNFEEAERNYLNAIRLNPNSCFIFTNYFELCLVNNAPFDPELLDTFRQNFRNDKKANASMEMLNIYNRIVNDNVENLFNELETWKRNYLSVGWDENFVDIENWIHDKVEEKFKKDLTTALNFFSSDSEFRNVLGN